ncbi:hypothetical protein ACFWPA_11865 [Rhodococcus sp. NPDC058505]|uniref:hypothetical protein n=1 Tax=unclassified Rhodococcus (in: high G+C Gram-positive bacteria) TaxID=192944 RepID=UPI003665AF76
MTTVDHTRLSHPGDTLDIAGTAWPLYKLEALVVGVLVFLTVLIVVQALQPAVLVAAGATVVVWWARRRHWATVGG